MNLFPRVFALVLTALWLAVSVAAQDNDEREGGIIGTGIVGTVTHLGGVLVNDLNIQIAVGLPVDGSIPSIGAGQLSPGHTIAIVTERREDGWHARQVRQVLPLVGPVAAVSGGDLTVLGTQVETGNQSLDLQVGDWVAVSGLWQGAAVLASRIDVLSGTDHVARLSGSYLGADRNGGPVIGGSVVSGMDPRILESGDLVRVFGRPAEDGIAVTRLETGLFDETVGLIQVEGYYSTPQPNGLYTILGSGLTAHTNQPTMIDTAQRVIQCGEEGRLSEGPASDAVNVQLFEELRC